MLWYPVDRDVRPLWLVPLNKTEALERFPDCHSLINASLFALTWATRHGYSGWHLFPIDT